MVDEDALAKALGEHFYDAACRWAVLDGDPPEALVLDRFVVAAQDALPLLMETFRHGAGQEEER